ncbi:MAG TPA: methyltransferase [Puia sp.]|nr:methyltransferase [Puia sp.]
MPNSYFQFKQFVIHQDRCAMKVCTDACIFGAWLSGKKLPWTRALDIGSGTGLLMLMLAQHNEGMIEGIELDSAAFGQLEENIGESKWKDRLRVVEADARNFVFPQQFDLIISNPPFFEGDLLSASDPENLAKHSKELTLVELTGVIDANLAVAGSFAILLPGHRTEYFEGLAAAHDFYLHEKLLVRQTPKHDFFRAMLYFTRRNTGSTTVAAISGEAEGSAGLTISELTIKNGEGEYTPEFVSLMRDYYLYL